jgi:hypothetical protein
MQNFKYQSRAYQPRHLNETLLYAEVRSGTYDDSLHSTSKVHMLLTEIAKFKGHML